MRTTRPSVPRPALAAVLLAVVGLSGVGLLLAAPASAARTITISITADGPKPASITAAVGDTIEFRNDDATFIHQARSASDNWKFDTRPLAPGAKATAGKLSKPGTYLYEGANLDSFTGKVVVPAPQPPPPAPAPASSKPASGGSTPPPATSPSPSPSSTGGSGAAGAPSLGGFGPGGLPLPTATPGGPAPDVAPVLPGEVPTAAPGTPGITASPGRLPEASVARAYGLPVALATVAAVGVASLILRLLLAQPAARRRRTA
ncbi:MAG: hypothetical protein ABIO67_03435 [Mycobacteriales bacterium]